MKSRETAGSARSPNIDSTAAGRGSWRLNSDKDPLGRTQKAGRVPRGKKTKGTKGTKGTKRTEQTEQTEIQ